MMPERGATRSYITRGGQFARYGQPDHIQLILYMLHCTKSLDPDAAPLRSTHKVYHTSAVVTAPSDAILKHEHHCIAHARVLVRAATSAAHHIKYCPEGEQQDHIQYNPDVEANGGARSFCPEAGTRNDQHRSILDHIDWI